MDLSTYMKQEGLTLTALAKRLGRPVPTVHGWLSGHRLPSLEAAVEIERATDGAVQPSTFVRESPKLEPQPPAFGASTEAA